MSTLPINCRRGNTSPNRGRPYQHMPALLDETYAQALWRMALNARSKGFRIVARDITGAYLVTSVADPGWRYRVTRSGCECEGFKRHQRCSHYAVLLAHLDEFPTDPEPDPAGAVLPAA